MVNDAAELAAPIAAAAVGVPHVTHAFGALLPEVRVRRAGEDVAALWRAEGLEPRPYGGVLDERSSRPLGDVGEIAPVRGTGERDGPEQLASTEMASVGA